MILTFGDVSCLKGQNWYLLEIRSEKTTENIVRRIGKAIPSLLKEGGCCEVFIPIEQRDLDLFTLRTGSYVFIRSDKKRELQKFKSVTGVVGLFCHGDQQRIDKAVVVDDAYVQGLIQEVETAFLARPFNIQIGSFVRIIDGFDKGFCGFVISIQEGFAIVQVDLKTRQMLIETPLLNLLCLDDVPDEQRVFYYAHELISSYVTEFGDEALTNLSKDRKFVHDTVALPVEVELEEKKVKYGRQKTVTAMAKRMIFSNISNPRLIIKEILLAIKEERIKKPKSAFILYSVLKQTLMETLFAEDNRIKTYKDVIKYYGEEYRFSPKMISDMDKEGLVPAKSEPNSRQKKNRKSTVIKMKMKDGLVVPPGEEND
jgi:hypothetical protein